MKFNVHAGHNEIVRGAKSILDEVTEDRKVKDELIKLLKAKGHTVYDCTDNAGKTQSANLQNIVKRCNAHSADLDISIHLNSGRNDKKGDGKTGGVEVLNYDKRTKAYSDKICSAIAKKLGYTNRGTKYAPNLYVLKNTKSLALLIECCFVDDKDDADKWNAKKCAEAICEALTGTTTTSTTSGTTSTKKSIDEIAKEVINGKWGSGENRKAKLKAAGYDYQTVQNRVNQLLGATSSASSSYYKKFTSNSIVDGLKSIGVNSSFSNRRKIAKVNGISAYIGTAKQNATLLALAKKGKLKKA